MNLRLFLELMSALLGFAFVLWAVSFLAGVEVWPNLPKQPTRYVELQPMYIVVDCEGVEK